MPVATRLRARAPLLAATLLAGLACRGELEMYRTLGPFYEAWAWLTASVNPFPLASNRFESRAAAAAFVDSLYAGGADTVYVLSVRQDSARIAMEGGRYADALLLRLPADEARRARLFQIGAREARREGFEPERDRGQRYLYFWWD